MSSNASWRLLFFLPRKDSERRQTFLSGGATISGLCTQVSTGEKGPRLSWSKRKKPNFRRKNTHRKLTAVPPEARGKNKGTSWKLFERDFVLDTVEIGRKLLCLPNHWGKHQQLDLHQKVTQKFSSKFSSVKGVGQCVRQEKREARGGIGRFFALMVID